MSRGDFYPKGSKGTLQCLVEEHKEWFDNLLNANLEWICPIKKNGYKECQLNKAILEYLGLPDNALKEFWPNRGPQWDGIAIGNNNTLYLMEAKSHFSEIYSKCNSKSKLQMIKDRLLDIKNYYSSNGDIENIWINTYYQIANRFVFLKKMKDLGSKYKEAKYKDVKLVFLNFENDPTWEKDIAIPKGGWDEIYDEIWKEMDIKKDKLKEEDVLIMCVDAKNW